MTRTTSSLVVTDCSGFPVDIGSQIEGGNGVLGEIVDFPDAGDGRVGVAVEWPDSPVPEVFSTSLRFAGGYPVLQCPEIEAAA